VRRRDLHTHFPNYCEVARGGPVVTGGGGGGAGRRREETSGTQ